MTQRLGSALEQGLLSDVRTVLADHGERFDPPHRTLDPAMAGGSLLDLGCYPTALATRRRNDRPLSPARIGARYATEVQYRR